MLSIYVPRLQGISPNALMQLRCAVAVNSLFRNGRLRLHFLVEYNRAKDSPLCD